MSRFAYGSFEYYQELYEISKANLCLVLVGLRALIDKPDVDKIRSQLRAVVNAVNEFESREQDYYERLDRRNDTDTSSV